MLSKVQTARGIGDCGVPLVGLISGLGALGGFFVEGSVVAFQVCDVPTALEALEHDPELDRDDGAPSLGADAGILRWSWRWEGRTMRS